MIWFYAMLRTLVLLPDDCPLRARTYRNIQCDNAI